MRHIFKYVLTLSVLHRVKMPKGAEILCIQTQNETPCIWALVDPDALPETRSFEFIGTGEGIIEEDVNRKYIGTFQLPSKGLVLHCFEFTFK